MAIEDREEHNLRNVLTSAAMFGVGYNLKNNYGRGLGWSNKKWAAVGAAFSAIPMLFSDNKLVNIATTGALAFGVTQSSQIKKTVIDNSEMFESMLKNIKKFSDKQNDIKEYFVEARQKLFKERGEDKGFIQGVGELAEELYGAVFEGKGYKKSKAYELYKQAATETDNMTIEDIHRLGKKIPFEMADYVTDRRNLERQIANTKMGSNITTTLGFFSKVEDGKLELDAKKYLTENANNIRSKIDFLDSLPQMFTRNLDSEEFKNYLNENGMEFFSDALEQGAEVTDTSVTYGQFMKKYGKQLFKEMGETPNKYFDKNGNAKYMNLLGNQIFSENIAMTSKGKMIDSTWFNPTNYVLDILKGAESSFRPFFKSLPFGENRKFPLLDTLGIDTKVYNSIYGNPMSNFYVETNDNIDLNKTYNILSKQIDTLKNVKSDSWRKQHGYKSISESLYKLNKVENIYNPRIKTANQVDEAIRLLEYKQSSVADTLTKTGGTLKKSSLIGLEDDMDKAYNRYFINLERGKMSLVERTENKTNSVFFNNQLFLKKNGKFEKAQGEYIFDLSKQTRIIQSKRAGTYYTTQANREGRYVEASTAPENFKFEDFKNIYENKGSREALNYIKRSDLNMIPNFSRNGYKDNDNVLDDFMEPINRVRNYLKINKGDKRDKAEIASLLLGVEKQSNSFYKKYNEEIDTAFDTMMGKYNSGMDELKDMITNNTAMRNRYAKVTGSTNIRELETRLKTMTNSNIQKIVDNEELSDNVASALKMRRGFEISSEKFNLIKDYPSLNNIGTASDIPVKKRLGDLFNLSNFKEDIIVNTFSQGKDFDEFKNSFGDLFENNLMFNKETLFNKNRITNINLKTPNIVRRAFTGIDLRNFESAMDSLNGENKMGTNLGMYFTKGLESFENTLSTIGIPKLNPDNMSDTLEYGATLFSKRIMPAVGMMMAYSTLNSAVDAAIPDSVPIIGQGLTAAGFKAIAAGRMALQVAINTTGLGFVFRKLEEMFPGMLTDNGLLSPLQLSATNEDMYAMLYEGKEVEDRKNRFWYSSGRQKFEGGEVQNIRPHLLYLGQQRTAGIYDNKVQRFFRQDFLPTKIAWALIDPYMEERINAERRPVVKSADLFNSEIPVIGGFINLAGKLIKPTKYFREDEWKVADGVMRNPEYDGQENTPEFINYDTSWKSTQAFYKAYEDIKSIMGMRGYMFGQAITAVFGTDNPIENNVRLETLNDGQNIIDRYNALNLGGMFGTTEPIRRMLGVKPIEETVSPLRNTSLPDWMPQNYFKNVSFGNVYNEIPFGEFILPGETYEKYNKLHPDDTGEYGVADRLKILSKVAPFSKEFRHTKQQALSRIDSMSREEKQMVYQALSYADKWRERDVDVNQRQEFDVSDRMVTVKRMEGPLEFYGTDNKRYKLSGVGLDFFDGKSNEQITVEMEELQSILRRGATFSGVVASDPIMANKTDNSGEYTEIYIPEFDKFRNLRSDSYLRHSVNSDVDITDRLMNAFKNAKKPASLEKIWGSKDTYARYYYENILDPSFKNWDAPFESFVSPILDTASTGVRGYASSMNIALRVGEFGDPVLPAMTTMSFLKGMVFGPNRPSRVERENELKDYIEYAKSQLDSDTYRGNFNSSIYNISERDGLSKMKNYLTMNERKYLDDIVNEINPETRQKLYDVSSDRMKIVLNTLWKRQAEYGGGTYVGEDVMMRNFEDEEIPEYNATNDTAFNDALFKYEMGFDLTSYEEKNVYLYGTQHLKEYKRDRDIAEYIDKMLGRGYRQKVLSTTMGNDMMIFDYRDV